MTTHTVLRFLFKVYVAAGLVAALTACGGGGGSTGKNQNTQSSQAAISSASSLIASSVTSSLTESSVTSSLTASSASSSLTTSSASSDAGSSISSFLMGGAIQGQPLNVAAVVSTFAGSAGGVDSFNRPYGITTDGTNLYVADTWNNTIRKIVISTGAVSTLAGSGLTGGDDGIGAEASFNDPVAITTDGTNLYVADSRNYTIRKIVIATGAVTTLAGTAGAMGSEDGTGAAARFSVHYGITTDGTNLYVADSNNYTIRKIVIATGVVTTLAGTAQVRGNFDGTGAAAIFFFPEGITTDGTNLYVKDTVNDTIRKIVIDTGTVTTFADSTGAGITTDGTSLYVAGDSIQKIDLATGAVTTLAGTDGVYGSMDGVGSAASFYNPFSITTDGFDLFVTDTYNNTIRKIH